MTPHIAWAFAQRNLTAAQRVVLIALAERANGERTCFPSETTLAHDCELSRRAVIGAVQYLHKVRGLIEIVTDRAERAAILASAGARLTARVNVYRILRPADGAKSAHSHGHNGAKSARLNGHAMPNGHDSAKSAHSSQSEGAKSSSQGCKKRHHECAADAHEPLTEPLNEEKKAESSFGEKEKSPPSRQDAPEPEPTPAEIEASRKRQLAELGDFAPLATAMARSLFGNYPPRAAVRSVDEMRQAVAPPLSKRTFAQVSPEHLAMLRRNAGYARPPAAELAVPP